jgi:rubredoxin
MALSDSELTPDWGEEIFEEVDENECPQCKIGKLEIVYSKQTNKGCKTKYHCNICNYSITYK